MSTEIFKYIVRSVNVYINPMCSGICKIAVRLVNEYIQICDFRLRFINV